MKYLILAFYLIPIGFLAQKVDKVSAEQKQNNIVISYNLESLSPCKIDLYISLNGGKSWSGPCSHVTGDVGAKVTNGKKHITLTILEEFGELRGDHISFKVTAWLESNEFVKIGSQTWCKENLEVITYNNGDTIPHIENKTNWENLVDGAWCYYENKTENGKVFGKLYNWYAVNDPRGLAPIGYHIPSEMDWKVLFLEIYNNSENNNNVQPNAIGNDFTKKFKPLQGGFRDKNGDFFGQNTMGYWWSSTETNSKTAKSVYQSTTTGRVDALMYNNKNNGFSIRCVKD